MLPEIINCSKFQLVKADRLSSLQSHPNNHIDFWEFQSILGNFQETYH